MSETGKKRYGRVWDPLVRLFHWVLVGAFATAWFERSEASIHQTAGKVVLVLIIMRTAWGLIGPASARFDTFVKGPVATSTYVFSIFKGRPAHYLGHNPAGAAMIGALLLSLATTAASGVLMTTTAFWGGVWIEWVHGTAATAAVFLIAGHLLGVAAACFQHKENLPLAMITGRKRVSVNTERFLGPAKFTKGRMLAALAIAATASAAWAGSSTLFNAGVWRMPKTIAVEVKKAGCGVAEVRGPRIVVYPALQLHYDVGIEGSDSALVAAIPALTAMERRPKIDISNVAADCEAIAGRQFAESLRAPLVKAAALFSSMFSGGQTAKPVDSLTATSAIAESADSPASAAGRKALLTLSQSAAAAGVGSAAAAPISLAGAGRVVVIEPPARKDLAKPAPAKPAAAPVKRQSVKAAPAPARPAGQNAKKIPRRQAEVKKLNNARYVKPLKAKAKKTVKRRLKRTLSAFEQSSGSGGHGSGSKNSGSGSDNSGSGSNNSGSGSNSGGSGSNNSGSGSDGGGGGGGSGKD